MTNSEKYKTAKERDKAFVSWCTKRNCHKCELEGNKPCCGIYWLDLKAEVQIENCPYCGSKCECRSTWTGKYRVACLDPDCWYSANLKGCVSDAIDSHNYIVRAAAKGKEVK